MADFSISYKKTSVNEGGYSNDSNDAGGETWKGIARNMHSLWEGWKIIDGEKKKENFPARLSQFPDLEIKVQSFYRKEFWNVIQGDKINSQSKADSIYDSAVNMGPGTAITLAQKALGISPTTGKMDDNTLKQLNS